MWLAVASYLGCPDHASQDPSNLSEGVRHVSSFLGHSHWLVGLISPTRKTVQVGI